MTDFVGQQQSPDGNMEMLTPQGVVVVVVVVVISRLPQEGVICVIVFATVLTDAQYNKYSGKCYKVSQKSKLQVPNSKPKTLCTLCRTL